MYTKENAPDFWARGIFNLVSFCINLQVWQANINSLLSELVLLPMEIQNDKSL